MRKHRRRGFAPALFTLFTLIGTATDARAQVTAIDARAQETAADSHTPGTATDARAKDDRWHTAPDLPLAVAAPATGVINGKFYVVSGGPIGGSGTKTNQEFDPIAGTWQNKALIPTGRLYASSAVVGGKLYVFGGCIAGDCSSFGNSDLNEIFDPVSDSWATGNVMPTACSQAACDSIGSKIYVVGGIGQCAPCSALATLQILDTATGLWTTGALLPTARAGAAAAVIDGKLHVIGGSAVTGYVATHDVYDPATNAWSSAAPLPYALANHGAVALNGLIYVIGGENAISSAQTAVLVYDPATDSWSACHSTSPSAHDYVRPQRLGDTIHVAGAGPANTPTAKHEVLSVPWAVSSPLPLAVAAPATGVIAGKLYVVSGGPIGGFGTTTNQEFDPIAGTWQDKAQIPTDRLYGSSAVVGGKLYVLGGCIAGNCSSFGNSDLNEIFDPVSDSWVTGNAMPTACSQAACDAIRSRIYVVGGIGQCAPCTPLDTLQILDTATGLWTTGAPIPTARAGAAAAAIGGKLHVLGGSSMTGYVATHDVYDPPTNAWSSAAPLPYALANHGAVVLNGILYILGGENASSSAKTAVLAYNSVTNTWNMCVTPSPSAHDYVRPQRLGNTIHIAGAGPANTPVANHEVYEIPSDESALAFGQGSAGSGGFVPSLSVRGCLEPAGNVYLTVDGGLGGATALAFFGPAQDAIPRPGGLLVSPLLATILPLPLSGVGPGNGHAELSALLPQSTTVPLKFTMQVLVPDSGVSWGYSVTNGVEVTIDP